MTCFPHNGKAMQTFLRGGKWSKSCKCSLGLYLYLSDVLRADRIFLRTSIGILISGKKQNTMDSIRTVVPLAKHVELDLYKRAKDLGDYNAPLTLEERVWEVARASRKLCTGKAPWQSDNDSTARRRMIKLM